MLSPLTDIGDGVSVSVGMISIVVVETSIVGNSTEGAGSITGVSLTELQAQKKVLNNNRKLESRNNLARFCMCLLYPLLKQEISKQKGLTLRLKTLS